MINLRSVVLSILCGILLCIGIFAGSCLAKADNLEVCRSFPLDLQGVRIAAEKGDAYCMAVLGVALSRGIGFEPDLAQSQVWKKRSWETGEPFGLYLKANFQKKQKSDPSQVKHAYKEARNAIEAVANSNDPHYEMSIGWIIQTGADGSKPDKATGCAHYFNAAQAGHPSAMRNYGLCWENGWMEHKDLEQAVIWHERAVKVGYSNSAWDVGRIFKENGDIEKARQYYSKAAKIGHAHDKLKWGSILENGIVGEPNLEAAAKEYQAASELGSTRATYRLAWLYFLGNGLPEDKDRATQLFKHAAQGGDSDAINMLKALRIE